VDIFQSNMEFIETKNRAESERLKEYLTFIIKGHGRQNDKVITFYEEIDKNLFQVPRYTHTLFDTKRKRLDIERDDFVNKKVKYPKFKLELRGEQNKAFESYMIHNDDNLLILPPSSGKTILSLYIAYMLKQKTIIVVHRSSFFNVWKNDIEKAFGIDPKTVGEIKGKDYKIGDIFTLATFQTLHSREYKELQDKFGFCIFDESHHVSASTFSQVTSQFKAKYMLGVTGTYERTDGLHSITNLFLGRIAYRNEKADLKHVEKATVYRLDTDVNLYVPKGSHIHRMYRQLLANRERWELFLYIFKLCHKAGRKQLVFMHSTLFAKVYCSVLNALGYRTMLMIGSNEERNAIAKQLMLEGKLDCIVATVQFMKEGESIANLDTIHFLTPVSNKIDWIQCCGRVQRQHPDKQTPLVLDYVDNRIQRCMRYLENRLEWSRQANSHDYKLEPFDEDLLDMLK
jgi:superfamily II DNA or RNA helicase